MEVVASRTMCQTWHSEQSVTSVCDSNQYIPAWSKTSKNEEIVEYEHNERMTQGTCKNSKSLKKFLALLSFLPEEKERWSKWYQGPEEQRRVGAV